MIIDIIKSVKKITHTEEYKKVYFKLITVEEGVVYYCFKESYDIFTKKEISRVFMRRFTTFRREQITGNYKNYYEIVKVNKVMIDLFDSEYRDYKNNIRVDKFKRIIEDD